MITFWANLNLIFAVINFRFYFTSGTWINLFCGILSLITAVWMFSL
jgi:hypothetical protein